MTNNKKRVLAGIAMALIAVGAGVLEYFNIPAVRALSVVIVLGMIVELILCFVKLPKEKLLHNGNLLLLAAALAWLILMLFAANAVGGRPWIILLLLLTISGSDIGAWFFGRKIGGDKMWERLSPNKTWSGQIAGIVCGTLASILYGLLGTDAFMPQLMWIGISVALLSQYGDLTASWIKRQINIKDFGTILPGHGGFLDRFDGWIYVLPLVWMIML